MKVISGFIEEIDSYSAGMQLITELEKIENCDLLFIFSNVNYDFTEFFEAIRDEEKYKNTKIVGATGDGIFFKSDIYNTGITFIAINFKNTTPFYIVSKDNIKDNIEFVVKESIDEIIKKFPKPQNIITFYNSIGINGSKIVDSFKKYINIPVYGGAAGDNSKFEKSFIFNGEKAIENGIVIIVFNDNIEITGFGKSGCIPFGNGGIVTDSVDNIVRYINHKKAIDFVKDELNGENFKDISHLALYPLAVINNNIFCLRDPVDYDEKNGYIKYAGDIKKGSVVKLSKASPKNMLEAAKYVVEQTKNKINNPDLLLIISCAGRRWLLSNRIIDEIKYVTEYFENTPACGFASFSEIGAIVDDINNESFLHNFTFVLISFKEK